MRAQWEKDIDWHQMQRDGLTPYREMLRWRNRALALGIVALVLAVALAIVLQVLVVVR